MFDTISAAPPDPILGLTEAFRSDSNPNKINLGVGVYKDEAGTTPVLPSVEEAGKRVIEKQSSKAYLPIDGAPDYGQAVRALMFGADHDLVDSGSAATSHTPGGTGALRVAGDFIRKNLPKSTLWLSEPTWPNHPNIFTAAGVPLKNYPYFDATSNSLDFDAVLEAVRNIPAGDVVLFHGCCHNPTGVDPTSDQWTALAEVVREHGLLPLLDFAYQGFASGIEEDAVGLRAFCETGCDMLVCSSFSKNFGLYRERVGALTVIGKDANATTAVQSRVKGCVRANYSNPPAHGAELVTTILNDAALTSQWRDEVAKMRNRINGMRKLLVETLKEKGVSGDYSFITNQRGMFSFSGLSPEQVGALKEKHSIYIVRSGRINVAGITPGNVGRLCEAIAEVS